MKALPMQRTATRPLFLITMDTRRAQQFHARHDSAHPCFSGSGRCVRFAYGRARSLPPGFYILLSADNRGDGAGTHTGSATAGHGHRWFSAHAN